MPESMTSALVMLSGIAVLLIVLFAAIYTWIPWGRFFNVSRPDAVADAGPAVAMLVLCTALAMPLGIGQRIQSAYQDGFRANLWACAASLFGLGGILTAIGLRSSLPWL